jgi:superfamily II DNA or RNA helicase
MARRSSGRKVSRLQPPPEMSLEVWQRELRRQFGSDQAFRLENAGDHPIFSDFRVTNPARGSIYRVAIRGAEPGRNYCSCPDFRTNALGTCKHIEFTLSKLRARRGGKRALLAGYEPPYNSINIDYGAQRHVRFRIGRDCPLPLRRLVQKHFDGDSRLKRTSYARFDDFIAAAKEIDPDLRIYEDVLPFVAEVHDAERRAQIIDAAFAEGVRSSMFDELLRTPLYDYQKEGAIFAARAGRSLIADEMGLGKTIQAIAAAEIMARLLGVERVLVVCPTSLKHQWSREIAQFSGRSARVIEGLSPTRLAAFREEDFFKITNYDTVHADLDSIRRWAPDLVILDEAQRIKNWATRAARSVKQIPSAYAIVLTGTPLENRLEELVSIVDFIDPFRLGPTYRFLDAHQTRDENGRVVGYRDLDRVAKTLSSVIIRRRKKDVLSQLPERLEKQFLVGMTPQQRAHHEENREIVARIAAKWRRQRHLSEADQRRLLIALQMMRMACDSTYLTDEQTDHGHKAGEIMTLLGEILEEERTKVVIFSQWLRMHEILASHIADAGWGHVLFHGGVSSRARAELVQRFRDDPACRLFLSTDAGGVGLNLQHATVVINVDLPWNPAILEQRAGRVHRLGQKHPVRVVNFVAEGTIEQGMLSILRFKKSLFAGVLDGGEKEVLLGKNRLARFMESVESVTAAIPAPPPASDPSPPPEAPLMQLVESGVAFLQQLAAALPSLPETPPKQRRVEARRDEDGSMYLAVPMPSRDAVRRFAEGLEALLRSVQG